MEMTYCLLVGTLGFFLAVPWLIILAVPILALLAVPSVLLMRAFSAPTENIEILGKLVSPPGSEEIKALEISA